jgi:hypothetical protein
LYGSAGTDEGCGWLQVLHVHPHWPVTITLANIIERSFPSEYAERRAELEGRRSSMDAHEPPVPLFVMASIFPGVQNHLAVQNHSAVAKIVIV